MLLSAVDISKNYGMKQLLRGVSLYLEPGQKVGIIGTNGTGKSTLLKVLSGAEEPDTGSVKTDPGVKISWLMQDPPYDPDQTVLEYTLAAFGENEREGREFEARAMLNRLDAGLFDRTMGTLSGGQRKRVALARTLLTPADVLLLDEPSNHLDMEMIRYLEDWLIRFKGGLIMVTHDRYFLQNVCNRIVELSLASSYEYEANWEKYLELKAERLEALQAGERKRLTLLRDERAWMMRGARARSTKAKAHIQRFEELNNASAPEMEKTQGKIMAGSSRLGKKTIELLNVSRSYGERPVIRDFTYTILRDDRIGILGRNGSGKSTLLNMIAGADAPDSGIVEIGQTVRVGYFRQENKVLDPEERAIDYIKDIAPYLDTEEGRLTASAMMEQFLFDGDLQYSKIGKLSGGERRRLYLLGILMASPNVLLLDEPTNDLDVATLTVLEHYLQSFQGPVIAVSHDRYFLDKIAQVIFEVKDGEVNRFIGGYTEYEDAVKDREEDKPAKKPAVKPPAPQRTHEKKLKFSFQEQRDYDTIEERMEACEERIAQLEQEMGECASNYMRLNELTAEKEAEEAKLSELEERWLYLMELKEKIDAQ